jgi:hypothetical protein
MYVVYNYGKGMCVTCRNNLNFCRVLPKRILMCFVASKKVLTNIRTEQTSKMNPKNGTLPKI